MKATARHRAHRKRRRDSGIVGQATTNEPIDTRVPACYACSTLVLVGSGGGTASVWLATFKPMSCLFSPVVAGALQRPRAVTLRPRPPTAVEAVNLTIHRSHSTAAATNKNTQGTENDSPSPARSNILRLSLAAGNAPFYTAIYIPIAVLLQRPLLARCRVAQTQDFLSLGRQRLCCRRELHPSSKYRGQHAG